MGRGLIAIGIALLALAPFPAWAQTTAPSALYINANYDPRANPYRDLERAIERASAENKRILIMVGGDWCVWCAILDAVIANDAAVHAAFARSFVILKVHWSRQNENAAFLSGFPETAGYPDFFVLERNGAFLGRQRTDALESGRGYDGARLVAFAQRWRRPDGN